MKILRLEAVALPQTARDLGVRKVLPLAVGGAVHTPLLAGAVDRWMPALSMASFSAPTVPIVDNTEAAVRTDAAWPELLARHLVEPVRWRASQEVLAGELGVTSLVELAPAGTLAAMARRTIPAVAVRSLDDLLAGAAVEVAT